MLTIGQLARIFEISTKTLRHYDAIGLFVPARTGSDNGYRYYQPEQIEQLSRILALRRLDVDNYGLDAFDRRYLQCIVTNYGGGPVGADTLAAALSEERDTIEEVVEPFLLKLGFLQRTPRGRVISDLGCEYLGIAKLRKNMRFAQNDLFDDLGDKD